MSSATVSLRLLPFLFVSGAVWSQVPNSASGQNGLAISTISATQDTVRIGGYMDSRGGFHAIRPIANDDQTDDVASSTAASTTNSGELKLTLNVTLDSTIPASDAVVCSIDIGVVDYSSLRSYSESSTVNAKRTGSTATCSVTIDYQWPALSSSNSGILITSAVTAGSAPTTRSGTWSFAAFAIPVNGTITTKSFTQFL